MTKFFSVTDEEAASSQARIPVNAVIPPFTFVGPLKAGVSTEWSPPHRMKLVSAYAKVATPSTIRAAFAILKRVEPDIGNDEVIGTLFIEPGKLKGIVYFDNSLIPKYLTYNEGLYVASFAATRSLGAVIQSFGERY